MKDDSRPAVAVTETGDTLFFEAETLLADESYEQASEKYDAYLKDYPEGQFVERALFKAASAHLARGNAEQARQYYVRLIDAFPDSSFVPEARLGILLAFQYQGMYRELIDETGKLTDDLLSESQNLKKDLLTGDAYLALDFPVDATIAYAKAHTRSPPEQQEIAGAKLKKAVFRLERAEIMYLLGLVTDDYTVGYLMYQLGLNRMAYEQHEDALLVLTSLANRFPEHETIPQVQHLITELHQTLSYDRYAIGCLLPLSGRYQKYGLRALNAIKLALAKYTRNDLNPEIRIVVKDTAADDQKTVRAVDQLVEAKVAAIIGPLIHVETAARKAQENEIPIITLTQKEDAVEIGEFVFRNFFSPRMQVRSLVSYVIDELGLYRFAILYPDERYGDTYMNLFWDEVIAHEGIVAGAESYDPKLTDFAEPIKKIVGLHYTVPVHLLTPVDLIAEKLTLEEPEEEPEENQEVITRRNKTEDEPAAIVDFDAVFIPDSPKQAGLIIPQLAFYDVNDVFLLGTNLWHNAELVEMAQQYVQAAIIPDGFFAASTSQQVQEFVADFQRIFTDAPGYIEAVCYDTAWILLRLTNQPGITTRWKLKEALLNPEAFQGVTGSIAFNNSGNVEKDLYLLRIKGNRFVELKRSTIERTPVMPDQR